MQNKIQDQPQYIPLRRRGSVEIDYAIVDLIDWGWASHHRWRKHGKKGYVSRATTIKEARQTGKQTIFMHREIARRMGLPERSRVIHKNGNTLDHRRENLAAIDVLKGTNVDIRVRKIMTPLPEPQPRKCARVSCGKEFTPRRKSGWQRFCSQVCQRKAGLRFQKDA